MSFPRYTQLDTMDCGPTCLRIIAAFYGRHYSLQNLRDRCHITREGVSLLGISDAAESIGLRSVGVKLTWQQLRDEANFPCIVHWNQRHFVVVYKIEKKRGQWWVYVSDPAVGLLKYSERQFLKSWLQTGAEDSVLQGDLSGDSSAKGIALLLEPKPEFYAEKGDEDKRLNFASMLRYLRPYKSYLLQLGLAMLIAAVLGLILPFLTQSVVDTGIGNSNLSFVVMILIAQVVLTLGQMANNLIRSWLMLHMTTRISISLISDFLAKLMRLPIAFFDSKMVGDIMQRIGDYNRIQTFLTGSLLSIVMAAVSLVIYSVVMAGYDLGILGVFLLGSGLYILWVLIFLKRRRKLDYMRFQESANNQSNIVQLINGMQDIKLNNCEKQKRWEWENIQASLFRINMSSLNLGQWQQVGAVLINEVKNVLITVLSATAVLHGSITLGVMLSIQYIIGQMQGPVTQFVSFMQDTQDAQLSLERLGEIHGKPDEETEGMDQETEISGKDPIRLNNVIFTYGSEKSKRIIKGLSLDIPAGKTTAIVGLSGSGKTTLIKLMLGFYPPTEGTVTIGRQSLQKISFKEWRKHCGVVMQEGFIFGDTIANNIVPDGNMIDKKRLLYAVEMANIRDFVESLPLKYNTKIGNTGQGLSQGQKQRILIARAIYRNPDYLFFDEATNALDTDNEKVIQGNLEKFFKDKTVVIVARRLSTVKNADQIVVLKEGEITEKGTHDELITRQGDYYRLVKNQLELSA